MIRVKLPGLLFLLLPCLLLLPPVSGAEAGPQHIICPINCEETRQLSLTSPALSGEDVRELQEQLYGLGYFNGLRNGNYDYNTYLAVKKFQQSYGAKPDGIVTEKTWQALGKATERPVTSKAIPPPKGNISIIIDTTRRTLTVLTDGEPYHTFPVAVGKHHTPTPIGNWKVVRKARDWGTGFGTRWLGLNVPWGIYGIHGTNKPYSIGGYQSHGCIRMNNRHVEQMFPWIPVGTPVIIVGNPFTYMDHPYKTLRRDDRGAAVMEVQRSLKRMGYNLDVDGIWGWGMEEVVRKYRKDAGLSRDNAIDMKAYQALGLKD